MAKEAHTKDKAACTENADVADQRPVNDHQIKMQTRGVSHPGHAGRGAAAPIHVHGQEAIVPAAAGVAAVPDPEALLTTPELAKRIQFSVRKVRQYVRAGRIPAVRLNRRDIRFHWPTVRRVLTGGPVQ